MSEETEIKELKAQLWGAKSTCNNCGNADCENYQRQRKSAPCELWISYRDKIIMSKEIIRDLLCLLEDYKEQIVFNEDLQKIKKAEDLFGILCFFDNTRILFFLCEFEVEIVVSGSTVTAKYNVVGAFLIDFYSIDVFALYQIQFNRL